VHTCRIAAFALRCAALAALCCLAPRPPLAAATEAPLELVDRIVSVVDDDPILLSEVERAIALGQVTTAAGDDARKTRRRALDQLIEQRLRYHEIERYGFETVSVQQVEAQVEQIRSRFAAPEEFARVLAALGLDEKGLRQLVARQLITLSYVEQRLGSRVFIGLEEISRYYDETFKPQLAQRGQPVPPLDDVREQIRGVLKEQRLNEEIGRWTAELRRQADVIDFLDREPAVPPGKVLFRQAIP